MKILITSLCIMMSLVAHAQSERLTLESDQLNANIADSAPTLTGNIIGYDPNVDEGLEIFCSLVVPFSHTREKKMVRILDDGSFQLTLDYKLPYQQIWFGIGDYYYSAIYLNDGLHLEADLQTLKKKPNDNTGVTLLGKDGPINSYLRKFALATAESYQELSNQSFAITMDRESAPKDVFQKLKATFDLFKVHIDAFVAKHPSPYSDLIYNDHYSSMYGLFFSSNWGKDVDPDLLHPCIAHQPMMITNNSMIDYYSYLSTYYKIPNAQEVYEIFVDIAGQIYDDGQISSTVQAYTDKINDLPYDEKAFEKTNDYYKIYAPQFDEAWRNLIHQKISTLPANKASMIKLMMAPEDIQDRIAYYKNVIPTTETEWCKKLMKDHLSIDSMNNQKVLRSLQATLNNDSESELGVIVDRYAFGADLYLPKQDSVTAFLQTIRNAFPDKAIILDIWATWCGPCIQDMHDSKETKSKLKDLGVEIIYLCTDSNSTLDKWKYKVSELESTGTHFFMNQNMTAKFFDSFKLGGYPSYIFIDKEGNYDLSLIQFVANLNLEAVKEKL